jgi:hypothetical protein
VLASVSGEREAARVVDVLGADFATEQVPGDGNDRHIVLRRRGDVSGAARLWQRVTGAAR